MAIHAHDFGRASALPLNALLASIPSLPRPILVRLTARLIDRLDEIDGDPDLEDDNEDCCSAGDDRVFSGQPNYGWHFLNPGQCSIGDDDDGELDDTLPDRRQLGRIRRTRCDRNVSRWGTVTWKLRRYPLVPSKRQLLTRKRGVPRRPRA